MEPAKIDWKRIDSRFVEDVFYEHIRAPKWFDFLGPDLHHHPHDDDAWFCRPDCDHPKTADDFLSTCPATSKLPNGGDADDILPARYPKQSDGKLRRRGETNSASTSNKDDGENENPNLAAPPSHHQPKTWRVVLKSRSVKNMVQNEEAHTLKSTSSARNLFQGRDIVGHISEFCYELKRLAARLTEREEAGKPDVKETQVAETNQQPQLLQLDTEKLHEVADSVKEKRRRKKRINNAENIPVTLNLENVKGKGDERLLQIRTNPPSPQCFSANRAPTKAVKPTRSKPMGRGILQEVVEGDEKSALSPSTVETKEGRGLDVLWFLKPCTLAG